MYYMLALLFLTHTLTAILQEETDFITSFINNYGFSSNSYDTREYHPFILEQTRKSFEQLETDLVNAGFNPIGRIIIAGYQEDAMPSYYTGRRIYHIDDETSIKTESGWQFAAGNSAGFLTGFALQKCNQYKNASITHILPNRIELFDARARLFHQHAFGESYAHAIGMYNDVQKTLTRGNAHMVLRMLNAWWKKLYIDACRDGAGNVIATQDMLFTIHYAQYLLNSSLPILQWYTGPDITYPIELLRCQSVDATEGAQAFVSHIGTTLIPYNETKTAYIFCSFVDGVGKSTLLGNVRNWQLHDTDFEQYERVDNSSSQRATLYHVSEKVVIADLPAQVSHHTIKPDGSVYVDLRAVKGCNDDEIKSLIDYARTNLPSFIDIFNNDYTSAYAQLCAQLKRTDTQWIPFSYNNHEYLVHIEHPDQIKMLVPFEKVHSFGLKVVEPEHMIFHAGVSMPLPYNQFLNDLSTQLRNAGVEQMVFVDFMSMYPRTSRETVRVNFLLQQLYALHDTFDQTRSFYHHTPHPHDYYLMLTHHEDDIARAITQETFLRYAWYDLLTDRPPFCETHIPAHEITPLLSERITRLSDMYNQHVKKIVHAKIADEKEEFEQTWAHDKLFQTLVRFDYNALIAFSSWMHRLFTHDVYDEYYRSVWTRNETTQLIIHKTVPNGCRDTVELKELISLIRAQWYATLSNILGWEKRNEQWIVKESCTAVPPLWIEPKQKTHWHVVQKSLPEYEEKQPELPQPFFNNVQTKELRPWGICYEKPYCMSWFGIDTLHGLYGYSIATKNNQIDKLNTVTHNWLYNREEIEKNPYITTHELLMLAMTHNTLTSSSCEKNYVKKCNREAAQLFVRAIATLDMILKDLDAICIIRKGNKDDFKAALILIEKIILPRYFGVSFPSPLFENYDTVEPVISWNICM